MKLADFNQPMGLTMNPENRWVKKAATIPWNEIEDRYAGLFPSKTGMPAKPLQTALGSLIIQKQYDYSDRELVEQIRENPYYQYFIGLPGYQDRAPFAPSLLVKFRKRLSDDILAEINEMIAQYNEPDDHQGPGAGNGGNNDPQGSEGGNKGTLILDATCAPQNIEFPQDVNLLNQARQNLESLLETLCNEYNFYAFRTYRDLARKDYLNFAKSKKRSAKKIRKAVKKQLQYIRRDLGYVDILINYNDVALSEKQSRQLDVIRELYAQQQYMYTNKTHSVKDRIVSINQPYIRPIVRGKAKAPVEFGTKLDMSIDDRGIARVERMSFDAYNEADVLTEAVERYRQRTGAYPERVLVDQIYRTRKNRSFCKEHNIRISGPALGRPKPMSLEEKKQAYQDNTDRIEVERGFSLAKRCYGLGRIHTKLDTTTKGSIVLSIIVMNINHLTRELSLLCHMMMSILSRYGWRNTPQINSVNTRQLCMVG